ncbi:LppU/SCO3897 family protein [Nocardia tengchongensis]
MLEPSDPATPEASPPEAQANPGWGQPVAPEVNGYAPPQGGVLPLDGAAEIPVPAPRKRRWWVWFVVLTVVIVGAAAGLFGWVLTRPDPVAFPVGACVSLEVPGEPVVYGCGDGKSLFSIVGREDLVFPVDGACAKYPDATRAVTDPAGNGEKSGTILCLAPTRFNTTDPGALRAEDCVDVKNAGETMTRVDCAAPSSPAKVVGVELHTKLPVTDQACKQHPAARMAFAQSSLGGRAIVVCANDIDASSMGTAKLGDCGDRNTMKKVACTDPNASQRVLSVRTAFGKPAHPECPDDLGANAVFTRGNDKTDLVLVVCMGPADLSDSRYAVVGDCITDNNARASSASDTHRIDCADPKAQYEVIDRHDSNDNACPSGTAVSLTYGPGTTAGLTICMRRR